MVTNDEMLESGSQSPTPLQPKAPADGDTAILGFNLARGFLYWASLSGKKTAPRLLDYGNEPFDPDQNGPELANFFKQCFSRLIEAQSPNGVAFRFWPQAQASSQVGYLLFPYGVLHLIGFERSLPVCSFTGQAFTKKALGYAGDKFDACSSMISGAPSIWKNDSKYAALSAWMCLK